jgi:hypothetical protein
MFSQRGHPFTPASFFLADFNQLRGNSTPQLSRRPANHATHDQKLSGDAVRAGID